MLLPILAYTLYHTNSGAAAVYDIISSYGGGGKRYPRDKDGISSYYGMTRDQMEYSIDALKDTFDSGWFTDDYNERISIFTKIAANISNETGADAQKVRMWLGEIFVTAQKDSQVINYLTGGDLTRLDVIKRTASEKLTDITETIKENVDFFVSYEPPIFGTIAGVVPWIAGAIAVYFGYKLLKTN